MSEQEVSFDPDKAVEGGGGLLQSVSEATLTFECVAYDYNGSVAVAVPAIHVHGEFEQDGEAGTFEEYYSAGDASKLRATKDGTRFQAITEGAAMTKTCKAMQLIGSLVTANGGDKSLLTANIKDLDGIVVNMERKPDVARPGLSETNSKGRTRTIMLVTDIISLPGEGKKKAKGKVAGKIAPKGGDKALKAKTIAAIEAVIEGAGGEVEADDLPQILFRKNKKDPDVKAMTDLAGDSDFLEGNGGWSLEDGTLKMESEE